MHDDPQAPTPAPPTSPPAVDPVAAHWQRQTDLQHLHLLSIFYYVFAGLQALGACGGALYFAIGAGFMAAPPVQNDPNAPPVAFMGGFFMIFGGCLVVFSAAWAILTVMAGLNLSRRQRKTFCMVVAALTCISIPLGTILGIFTFVVLNRPSVAALFDANRAPSNADLGTHP